MQRVFITGGSGFIGTNLVQHFLNAGSAVSNFDQCSPRNPAHVDVWTKADLCDAMMLIDAVAEFRPHVILHVAARTDLDGIAPDDYVANSIGVENLITAARLATGVHRIVFFSSMLVCEFGYIPLHETDYCPTTLYGQSKVTGEKLVREIPISSLPWVLVRPTSIWGPWFGAPYRNLFELVRAGRFALPRGSHSICSYGYVDNLVAQVASLIDAPPEDVVGRTYYLADYDPLELSDWTNAISAAWGRGKVREVPFWLLQSVARCGDAARRLGWSNPPLTSFRLKNLVTSAVFDMSHLVKLCPNLPVKWEEGVRLTVDWLRGVDKIRA
jgi:nucleoside-diphosphate-sugar epimerase